MFTQIDIESEENKSKWAQRRRRRQIGENKFIVWKGNLNDVFCVFAQWNYRLLNEMTIAFLTFHAIYRYTRNKSQIGLITWSEHNKRGYGCLFWLFGYGASTRIQSRMASQCKYIYNILIIKHISIVCLSYSTEKSFHKSFPECKISFTSTAHRLTQFVIWINCGQEISH